MSDVNILIWVVIAAVSVLIFGSVYLIYKGLQNPARISQVYTGIGFCLIFFVFIFLFFVTTLDSLFIFSSIFMLIVCVVITLLAVMILWKKPEKIRKSFRLLLIAAYTVGFCTSVFWGYLFTPTQRIERDGGGVIRALDDFHSRKGFYPASLAELESSSTIQFVKAPSSLWGWLYIATDNDFSLGFIKDVDKFGYWICQFPSKTRQWDCVPEAQTPFHPDPTPGVYETEPYPALY